MCKGLSRRKRGEPRSLKEGQVAVEGELRAVRGADEAGELGRRRVDKSKEAMSQGKPCMEFSRG